MCSRLCVFVCLHMALLFLPLLFLLSLFSCAVFILSNKILLLLFFLQFHFLSLTLLSFGHLSVYLFFLSPCLITDFSLSLTLKSLRSFSSSVQLTS